MYFKQRLMTSAAESEDLESKNLLYFDMATVWIAPIELQLDNEIVIRTLRIFNAVKHELDHSASSRSSKGQSYAADSSADSEVYTPLGVVKEMSFLSTAAR